MSRDRFPPRADLEYDEAVDGFPGATCMVCGGEPCVIRVRWWETAHKPLAPGRFVREGRSESHFFCFAHRQNSERVYIRFTTMEQKRTPAARR